MELTHATATSQVTCQHRDANATIIWSATAFQHILDLVKRWWLDGFAARMVNGQLAIACPLDSHRISLPLYTVMYATRSSAHPEAWNETQHVVRIEAQRRGQTQYHFLVAREQRSGPRPDEELSSA